MTKKIFGFERTKRLRQKWEYRRLSKGSEKAYFVDCMVFRKPNEHQKPRLGITVRAKTDSVRRNYTKRMVRDAFRAKQAFLGAYDYNVVVQPGEGKCLAEPAWQRRFYLNLLNTFETADFHAPSRH